MSSPYRYMPWGSAERAPQQLRALLPRRSRCHKYTYEYKVLAVSHTANETLVSADFLARLSRDGRPPELTVEQWLGDVAHYTSVYVNARAQQPQRRAADRRLYEAITYVAGECPWYRGVTLRTWSTLITDSAQPRHTVREFRCALCGALGHRISTCCESLGVLRVDINKWRLRNGPTLAAPAPPVAVRPAPGAHVRPEQRGAEDDVEFVSHKRVPASHTPVVLRRAPPLLPAVGNAVRVAVPTVNRPLETQARVNAPVVDRTPETQARATTPTVNRPPETRVDLAASTVDRPPETSVRVILSPNSPISQDALQILLQPIEYLHPDDDTLAEQLNT